MKMPGRCTGPKFLSKGLGKMERRHLGGHDFVTKMDRHGEAQKVFGISEAKKWDRS